MDVGWDPAHQEKYPHITFTSTDITAAGETAIKVTGDLTINGVTKSVTLNFDISAVKQA